MINMNEGIDDGCVMRRRGLQAAYPNIRQVPGNILNFDFMAFTRNNGFSLHDPKDLIPYSVGVIRGWKTVEQNLKPEQGVTWVRSPDQLFRLLAQGRVDIVIYERWQGQAMLRKLGLTDIKMLEPPLWQVETFIYLNKKHEALVPRAAAALEAIKTDGTYAKIADQTLSPVRLLGTGR